MSLGEVYIQQGRLIEASELFSQLISSLSKENQVPIIMASLYLDLAKTAFLRGENKQAYALLEDSKAYGQRYSLINWEYNYYLLLARVYCSEGFLDLARDCLRESKEYYVMSPIPDEVSFEDMETMIDMAEIPSSPVNLSKEHANQSLEESLTVRELEVLALIASGLSNQEICNTLFLALSTVKGYNQAIYGKLQVKRRTEAVVKAKVLGLV
jgi:ATP/maltotriose-dependent transcriptional regulator MalT